jgi:hypothetical protein
LFICEVSSVRYPDKIPNGKAVAENLLGGAVIPQSTICMAGTCPTATLGTSIGLIVYMLYKNCQCEAVELPKTPVRSGYQAARGVFVRKAV